MKRNYIGFAVCLLVGLGLGWFLGYTRPSVVNQRKILKQYESVRDGFQMTDEEMTEVGQQLPDYFDGLKRQDEMAAVFALGGFRMLERGDVDAAKRHMSRAVGLYYLVHKENGDPDLIARIEEAAATYPALQAELVKREKSSSNEE